MSAFNNNNTNLNNTSAGIEARVSHSNPHSGTGSPAHNIETAYQREQPLQSSDLHAGNNLNDTYNRFQPGQPGAGDNLLNENHGIAATGLNEPHTHATVPTTHGNSNLNYSGAEADVNKVDQTGNYGHTAGQDLNSTTNRTAGTGIPPVNTAEHVRRNQAQEQQANYGHTAGQDLNSTTNRTAGTGIPPVNTAEHIRRNQAEEAVHKGEHGHHHNNTASLGDHGASHHDKHNGGVGLEDKARAHEATHGHNTTHDANAKVSASDKIKGNLEKVVGKITGNEEKVVEGEKLAQGRAV